MAEATLRGYIEIPAPAAKALLDAGWPVETRYFVPRYGTMASNTIGTQVYGTEPRRKPTPKKQGSFVGLGDKTPEELHLTKGRRHYGDHAQEILMKHDTGVMRKAHLINSLYKFHPFKPGEARHAVASQLTHLIRLGVLVDHGNVPPKLMGTNVKKG